MGIMTSQMMLNLLPTLLGGIFISAFILYVISQYDKRRTKQE